MNKGKVLIEVYDSKFFILPSHKDKAILLGWTAETSLGNFVRVRWVVLTLKWPFIHYINDFVNFDA